MLTNADMTIYNKVFDSVTKTNKYNRTQVTEINWHNDLGTVMASETVTQKDMFKVRTDNYEKFLPAAEYLALADKTGFWTVQRDDVIAKGLLTTEITGIATLQALKADCFRVTSYSDNRRGGIPNIRIGGE